MRKLLLVGFALILGTAGRLVSQTEDSSYQSLVTISWQIRLDNPQGFDFSDLSVLIQYHPSKELAWAPLPLIRPDSMGAFTSTIPRGNLVSLQIGASDPTLRDLTDRTDPFRPYQLGAIETHTVLRQDFYVAKDSPGAIHKVVQLRRGAAFRLCIPLPIKTGSIRYRLRGDKGTNAIFLFTDSSAFADHTVAGLKPGNWTVEYVSDDDAVQLSQRFKLKQGQVLNAACRSGYLDAP